MDGVGEQEWRDQSVRTPSGSAFQRKRSYAWTSKADISKQMVEWRRDSIKGHPAPNGNSWWADPDLVNVSSAGGAFALQKPWWCVWGVRGMVIYPNLFLGAPLCQLHRERCSEGWSKHNRWRQGTNICGTPYSMPGRCSLHILSPTSKPHNSTMRYEALPCFSGGNAQRG